LELAQRYDAYLGVMKKNAVMIFYDGGGRIRAVTKIMNTTLPPSPENYENDNNDYFLDDPYEGELMAFFMDFFGGKELVH
jgi:hypothetical protein